VALHKICVLTGTCEEELRYEVVREQSDLLLLQEVRLPLRKVQQDSSRNGTQWRLALRQKRLQLSACVPPPAHSVLCGNTSINDLFFHQTTTLSMASIARKGCLQR
jgi:hypothetical protein